ncbi:hypothetical protein H4R35_005267 [Dimargaris xerosporica]|nr:hypothetical protein H4R35_005267 [Dimargaris xerosporica]
MYKILVTASLIIILGAWVPSSAAPVNQQLQALGSRELQPRAVPGRVLISRGAHYQSLFKRTPGGSKEESNSTEQEPVVDEKTESDEEKKIKKGKGESECGKGKGQEGEGVCEGEDKGGDEVENEDKGEDTSPKKCGNHNDNEIPGETGPTASASAEGPIGTSDGQEYSGGTITHHNFSGENNACGGKYEDTDLVVALDTSQFADGAGDDLYDNNPNCGRTVEVTRGGKTIQVKVVDQCTTCGDASLDLSPAAFKELEADLDKGELHDYTWKFV